MSPSLQPELVSCLRGVLAAAEALPGDAPPAEVLAVVQRGFRVLGEVQKPLDAWRRREAMGR